MFAPMLFWQYLFLAFFCGVLAGVRFFLSLFLLFLLCLLSGFERKREFLFCLIAYLGGLFFISCSLFLLPIPSQTLPDEKLIITGQVFSVRHTPGQRLQCVLQDVFLQAPTGKKQVEGRLVLTWKYPLYFPVPGQTLTVRAKVRPIHGMANTGGWDSQWYWRQRGVFWRAFTKADRDGVEVVGSPSFFQNIRGAIRSLLAEQLPENSGRGLAFALLLGERLHLSYDLVDKVQRSGLAHSLALSGMHVGIVISFGFGLAWLAGWFWPQIYLWLPRKKLAVLCAAPLVAFYVWLGGASLSLQRAALMFAVWGFLFFLNRKNILLDGLVIALGLICLLQPLALFDLSLQMSVLAVVGIALFLPFWQQFVARFLPANFFVRYFALLFGLSLGANIALFPVLVWYFNMFSLHLVYNLVWLPVLGLVIMPLLFLGLLFSPFLSFLSSLCFQSSAWFLHLFVQILDWLDERFFLEPLFFPRPYPEMALAWWVGFWGVFLLWQKKGKKRLLCLVCCLFVFACFGSLLRLSLPFFRQDVELHLLDTGMSQSVLLSLPRGKRMLIDGGGFWNSDFDVGKAVVAPRLTLGRFPKLEQVVLTHDDVDHRRGLIFLLRHFQVDAFVWNGRKLDGKDGEQIRAILHNRQIPAVRWQQGDRIELCGDLVIDVLWPPREYVDTDNNLSLVLRLSRDGHGLALLPGDIENEALQQLLGTAQNLQADVLIAPHHGSRGSLNPELYARVRPTFVLVAAGFKNRFQFPHAEVVEFCQTNGIEILTTATSGEIRVVWPARGEKKRITTQRQPEKEQQNNS